MKLLKITIPTASSTLLVEMSPKGAWNDFFRSFQIGERRDGIKDEPLLPFRRIELAVFCSFKRAPTEMSLPLEKSKSNQMK